MNMIFDFVIPTLGSYGWILKLLQYALDFFVGFLAYLVIWKAWKIKKGQPGYLPLPLKIISALIVVPFGAIDIAFNFIVGTIIFMEFPRVLGKRKEWTLSLRSERYHDRIVENPNFLEKWRHVWGVCLAWLLNPFSVAIGDGEHI